jgi:aminodeoxyfutalosine deaminase
MKRFSSQYLITNSGPMLKRPVINVADDGTIENIEDTSGDLSEKHSVEFYNGIIIPGFVNCHCHLELSHMKGVISSGTGLGTFIEQIRSRRNSETDSILAAAVSADNEMYNSGISLCADICNTTETFDLKKESKIKYINLLEVFGIDPEKAAKRMNEVLGISEVAEKFKIPCSMVPHSFYSTSLPLLRLLRKKSNKNKVTSIHFMETPAESEFLQDHSGPLKTSYMRTGLLPAKLETVTNHADGILNEITQSGNLILVHNTFADRATVKRVLTRKNTYWCLCPHSNKYIENTIPPVKLLCDEGCEIVLGTDSLASNQQLDILGEIIALQLNFPMLSIEELIRWATLNGAKALGEENLYGTIEAGKKPGLLLLQNLDLQNMKLLKESFVTRLV